MKTYLARWWHYGAGEWVYYELEATTEEQADATITQYQVQHGYTPGDYDLYLMLENE